MRITIEIDDRGVTSRAEATAETAVPPEPEPGAAGEAPIEETVTAEMPALPEGTATLIPAAGEGAAGATDAGAAPSPEGASEGESTDQTNATFAGGTTSAGAAAGADLSPELAQSPGPAPPTDAGDGAHADVVSAGGAPEFNE